jgi:hypothetical protein
MKRNRPTFWTIKSFRCARLRSFYFKKPGRIFLLLSICNQRGSDMGYNQKRHSGLFKTRKALNITIECMILLNKRRPYLHCIFCALCCLDKSDSLVKLGLDTIFKRSPNPRSNIFGLTSDGIIQYCSH